MIVESATMLILLCNTCLLLLFLHFLRLLLWITKIWSFIIINWCLDTLLDDSRWVERVIKLMGRWNERSDSWTLFTKVIFRLRLWNWLLDCFWWLLALFSGLDFFFDRMNWQLWILNDWLSYWSLLNSLTFFKFFRRFLRPFFDRSGQRSLHKLRSWCWKCRRSHHSWSYHWSAWAGWPHHAHWHHRSWAPTTHHRGSLCKSAAARRHHGCTPDSLLHLIRRSCCRCFSLHILILNEVLCCDGTCPKFIPWLLVSRSLLIFLHVFLWTYLEFKLYLPALISVLLGLGILAFIYLWLIKTRIMLT